MYVRLIPPLLSFIFAFNYSSTDKKTLFLMTAIFSPIYTIFYIISKFFFEVNFFLTVKNSTILIVGLLIVGGLGLLTKNEYIATTILGGLLGFLAKDPVVLEEIVEEEPVIDDSEQ